MFFGKQPEYLFVSYNNMGTFPGRKNYLWIENSDCWHISMSTFFYIPVGIYLLKVKNRNTRTIREICSKLTIKTLK